MSRVIKNSEDKKLHIGLDCHAKGEIEDLQQLIKSYPKEVYAKT
jgi:hypothetical protein